MSQIYLLVQVLISVLFIQGLAQCSLASSQKADENLDILADKQLVILKEPFDFFLFIDLIICAHPVIVVKEIGNIGLLKKRASDKPG